ncbi:MAG: methionyl-tRNA formyltransferase [Candidatus Dojkabacteria bacterium]|nr:MAG: methionyl-tRNA formyltransferase [Candidatus Dojkabacteria bacterium]
MSISFYGSSFFSLIILKRLFDLHQDGKIKLAYVVSQSSKPFGRHKEIKDNPVVIFCKDHNITTFTPNKIKDLLDYKEFHTNIDLGIVAAYGKILPGWLLKSTRYGFVNIHGSLLPKYRGAIPVQSLILNQDIDNAGVTFIRMDEGMDTGDIILKEPLNINVDEFSTLTTTDLMEKLANLSADVITHRFDYIFHPDEWQLITQDNSKATYCYVADMQKSKFEIHYSDGYKLAHGKVMAANPEPKAFITLKQSFVINILRSKMPGTNSGFLDGVERKHELSLHFAGNNLYLELKDGFLEILELQPQGRKIMNGVSFINGYRAFLINS